ncbi:MAG TPA: SdiA-regulated domain-containing protein [Chitinophagaceae bacterium]|nr:SdiA-regulated domain-containing protein [Chitinophagaceae bacterium]HMX76553.1 SdiA-regulated domain-containing protein [Chitinophagaceae bacterium]HNA18318.1 SdiA-regulated domain-containing protein [Chitinophagaceae bacterium]HND94289.1 SdiA-regulated domain-containing protein [Chitinophagaceae bacterium]HNF37065.1 SdiA-regulated domain-containing protein [Chitinophagaceae bacterium]
MKILRFPALALLLGIGLLAACKQRVRVLKSPPNYSFAFGSKDKLDVRLLHISGITWDNHDNLFYAVNTGSDTLYALDRISRSISEVYPIGAAGDYEDVALFDSAIYILRKDGTITKFTKDSSTGKATITKVGEMSLAGANEFESLYADTAQKALVLICKNCEADDENTVSAYAFYPDSIGFTNKPIYKIDAGKVDSLSPFKTGKFRPSAAAINPMTKKLFILSEESKQLVIADLNGVVNSVFKLSPKLFSGPKGIAFHKTGEMYITNEAEKGKASFVKFAFKDPAEAARKSAAGVPYNFSTPDEKLELGSHLHEISGMAWVPSQEMILAENDEKGDVFTVDFKNRNDNVRKIKFGGKGDYEDIVYKDSATIYMLVSSGSVVKVNLENGEVTGVPETYELPADKKNEFETMYLDEARNSLMLLCKECAGEKKTEVRKAYRFDLASNTFDEQPAYVLQINAIKEILNDATAEFKPSAAAINPVDDKLYIVASVGKLLVVANKLTGKPENVVRLDPKLFNQPEGITITPEGDIYISNEGGTGVATIFKFIRQKK